MFAQNLHLLTLIARFLLSVSSSMLVRFPIGGGTYRVWQDV
jgi:hypothetical protein